MSATDRRRSFTDHQRSFLAYIRDPDRFPAPSDIEKRRIDLYRELIFNNMERFLSKTFPVLRRLTGDANWMALVQEFFSEHRCKSPYFSEIPEEFLGYLQQERGDRKGDFPFMVELVHYEWVEMALAIATDIPVEPKESILAFDDLKQRFSVSSLAWPLAYRYPVHQVSVSFKPETPPAEPTYLVVYRNQDCRVKFMQINAMIYRFLQVVEENPEISGEDCLLILCREIGQKDLDQILRGGVEMLQGLTNRGIISIVD
ncbi:MAG: putative DNA-binding domain-containing protein [Pseudomonadota bacterium]|nr:putative DNA-binding domain-containing protein [Pseudomonadota bacterium]